MREEGLSRDKHGSREKRRTNKEGKLGQKKIKQIIEREREKRKI